MTAGPSLDRAGARIRALTVGAALLAAILPGANIVFGATYVVTTTTDGGPGSLRQAILDANANPGADTVTLPAGTYTLTIVGSGDDGGTSGDLDITDSLTINGAGAATTIIDAAGIDRVLHVLGSSVVAINGVTMRNGASGGDDGGGIHNSGSLTLADSVLEGNVSSDKGGGISSEGADASLAIVDSIVRDNTSTTSAGGVRSTDGGSMTVTRSLFSGNTTGGDGAAIQVEGPLTVTDSTISGNSAGDDGGAISIETGDPASIARSTISGNTAGDSGGAMQINGDGDVTIVNSTFSGNGVGGSVGSALAVNTAAVVDISHSTLTGNVGAPTIDDLDTADVTITNSIVAGVTACGMATTSGGGNVFGDASCAAIASDLTSTDAVLGTLADNGGPTRTHALLAGSPAIDHAVGCPVSVDQRGESRPAGAACDAGAFEVQGAGETPAPATPTATPAAVTPPPTDGAAGVAGEEPWKGLLGAVLLAVAAWVASATLVRRVERRTGR